MAFVKTHQPCPVCGKDKACGINEDNSAKCFKCDAFIPDYNNPEGIRKSDVWEPSSNNKLAINKVTNIKTHSSKDPELDITKCSYNALKDRGLSLSTAKFYGVKSLLDSEGNPLQHWYPYYKDNEVVAYKVRKVPTKDFRWVHLKEVSNKNFLVSNSLVRVERYLLLLKESVMQWLSIRCLVVVSLPYLLTMVWVVSMTLNLISN